MSQSPAGIVLAAGRGTRMRSELPKVLHPVCGLPMVEHVLRALRDAGVGRLVVVIGHGADQVQAALGGENVFARQDPPDGTGGAAAAGLAALADFEGPVVVASGDAPLVEPDHLRRLLAALPAGGAVVASMTPPEPTGYGRIVREGDHLLRIVEDRDADPATRAIREVNAGLYAFDAAALRKALPQLRTANAQGELYLTDAFAILREMGCEVRVEAFSDATAFEGANDRWQLAGLERAMRQRINRRHALNGVTLVDPDTTYIGPDVEIGADTVIEPATYLQGRTRIGPGCHIGPNTKIRDTEVAEGCFIYFSHVVGAVLRPGVKVGPYANIRPASVLGKGVKVGNFVETKNTDLGEDVAVSHLTYLGDATVGARTNVGAGTITCNYDGFEKHRTQIGADAFVGSNSTLVAPVIVGDGAMLAAGSVVTHDVPSDAIAFGRARQENKEGWVSRWKGVKRSQTRSTDGA